jgi:hypothetical protein
MIVRIALSVFLGLVLFTVLWLVVVILFSQTLTPG